MINGGTYKNPYRNEYLNLKKESNKYDKPFIRTLFRGKLKELDSKLRRIINKDINASTLDEELLKDKYYRDVVSRAIKYKLDKIDTKKSDRELIDSRKENMDKLSPTTNETTKLLEDEQYKKALSYYDIDMKEYSKLKEMESKINEYNNQL